MHKNISYQVTLNAFKEAWKNDIQIFLFMFKQHEYTFYILKANYLLDAFDKFKELNVTQTVFRGTLMTLL